MKTMLALLVATAFPTVALAAPPTPQQQAQAQQQRYRANQQALFVAQHKGFAPSSAGTLAKWSQQNSAPARPGTIEFTNARQALAYGYQPQPGQRLVFNQK